MIARLPLGRLHLIRFLPVLALAVLSSAACHHANAPAAAGSPASTGTAIERGIDGSWVHQEMPVRYRETMTLTLNGLQIRGEGTYMMEGGREGTTTITGTLQRGMLTLYIIRDSGVRERWRGRLTRGALRGELVIDGRDRQIFGFDRPGAASGLP
jgi:hypothetical protein